MEKPDFKELLNKLNDAAVSRPVETTPTSKPISKPAKPSKPYIWRDQYGMSTDDYKRQDLERKRQASAEWAFQMGCRTNPEGQWPGV